MEVPDERNFMKNIRTALVVPALALAAITMSAPKASAVTYGNRVCNGTGVNGAIAVQYKTGAWFYPSSGSCVSDAQAFIPKRIVHSYWGKVYWVNEKYSFASSNATGSSGLWLYDGMN
jgi:hypothetical protein